MGRGVHFTAVRGHRTTGIWLVWRYASGAHGYSRGTHDILDKLARSASVGHALHVRFSGRVTQRRAVRRTTASGGFVRTGYLGEWYSMGAHGVLTWVVLAMRIAFLPQWQHLEDAVGTALQRSLGHIGVSFV